MPKEPAVVVEDVQAVTRPGKGGKWNGLFSPVQVGKEHLSHLLQEMGLEVQTREGWQTKELREHYGLKKTKSKSKPSFESHAVDAWVMAASVCGSEKPTCQRLWYLVPAVARRRGGDHKTPDQPDATPITDKVQQVLTETRMVLPGAQALLGFGTIAVLMDAFKNLPSSATAMTASAPGDPVAHRFVPSSGSTAISTRGANSSLSPACVLW